MNLVIILALIFSVTLLIVAFSLWLMRWASKKQVRLDYVKKISIFAAIYVLLLNIIDFKASHNFNAQLILALTIFIFIAFGANQKHTPKKSAKKKR